MTRKNETESEYQARWYQEHKEQAKAYRHAYWAARREQAIVNAHIWRTRQSGAGGSFTVDEWLELKEKCNGKCPSCGKQKRLIVHHKVSVGLGGTSNIKNIEPICYSCHNRLRRKHA